MKVCSLSRSKYKQLASVAVGISYVGPLGEIQGGTRPIPAVPPNYSPFMNHCTNLLIIYLSVV